jgi:hypothetical protein
MHARAERTLEIVEVDHYHLGCFRSARGPPGGVDLAHCFGIRILVQIELVHANQGGVIFGKQEVQILLSFAVVDGDH